MTRDPFDVQVEITGQLQRQIIKLEAQRDALLEFAKYVEAIDPNNPAPLFEKARAAIKAVEGETK